MDVKEFIADSAAGVAGYIGLQSPLLLISGAGIFDQVTGEIVHVFGALALSVISHFVVKFISKRRLKKSTMGVKTYTETYYKNALEACQNTTIFPLVAIGESAVESSWGNSQLAQKANNFFGIKAQEGYVGRSMNFPTKEFDHEGKPYYIDAAFRAYDSPTDSFKDWINVLHESRYVNAGVENTTTPQEQIQDIAKAGYSTSPTYANLIIEVMKEIQPFIPAT